MYHSFWRAIFCTPIEIYWLLDHIEKKLQSKGEFSGIYFFLLKLTFLFWLECKIQIFKLLKRQTKKEKIHNFLTYFKILIIQTTKILFCSYSSSTIILRVGIFLIYFEEQAKNILTNVYWFDFNYFLLSNNWHFIFWQVTSEDDVKEALRLCESKFKKLNVLVNCAGIGPPKRILSSDGKKVHPLDSFKKIIEVRY